MPQPLTVSCFSKIQIGFTFLVLAHPGSPGKRAVKLMFVVVVVVVDFLFQTPVFVSFVNFDNYLAAVIEIAKKIK